MGQTNEEYLSGLITNLSKEMPYQWRVQSYSKFKPQGTCVAYISARDAIAALNTYAIYGWNRRHYMVGEHTYCEVGVIMPDGSTQWRSDCGTESNQDAEKGQASDSFKRACVNFGIGKFLYDLGMEYIDADSIKGDKDEQKGDAKYKRFPNPVDERGGKIWNISDHINNRKRKGTATPNTTTPAKAPVKPAAKKPDTLAESVKSALQPSRSFDAPSVTTVSPDELEARTNALKAYKKLDQSIVLNYLIKDKKIMTYPTVELFVNGHDLVSVRAIYSELTAKKA